MDENVFNTFDGFVQVPFDFSVVDCYAEVKLQYDRTCGRKFDSVLLRLHVVLECIFLRHLRSIVQLTCKVLFFFELRFGDCVLLLQSAYVYILS